MKFVYFCLKNPSVSRSYDSITKSVGKNVVMVDCEVGSSMLFYLEDGWCIKTSPVENICVINKCNLYVETKNSIYIFEE